MREYRARLFHEEAEALTRLMNEALKAARDHTRRCGLCSVHEEPVDATGRWLASLLAELEATKWEVLREWVESGSALEDIRFRIGLYDIFTAGRG